MSSVPLNLVLETLLMRELGNLILMIGKIWREAHLSSLCVSFLQRL